MTLKGDFPASSTVGDSFADDELEDDFNEELEENENMGLCDEFSED